MDRYEETKEVLNNMATVKMTMNDHKGNIEECADAQLLDMLRGEIEELEQAVQNESMIEIIEEAADVMNFLVALVHKQLTIYRERK